jgi:hypothetical protein
VQIVVAIGDLRHEQDFVVMALGAAAGVVHARTLTDAVVRRFAALALVLLVVACDRGKPASTGDASAATDADGGSDPAPVVERTPDVEQLWTEAKDGDDDALARLAVREGPAGLVERAGVVALRPTALRALGHTEGWVGLPTLAAAAKGDPEELATFAVQSASMLAARKRRQVDPEDAAELREGCDVLLAAAKDATRPRPVRVGAVRALRMLLDRGCAKASDIPADVDVK